MMNTRTRTRTITRLGSRICRRMCGLYPRRRSTSGRRKSESERKSNSGKLQPQMVSKCLNPSLNPLLSQRHLSRLRQTMLSAPWWKLRRSPRSLRDGPRYLRLHQTPLRRNLVSENQGGLLLGRHPRYHRQCSPAHLPLYPQTQAIQLPFRTTPLFVTLAGPPSTREARCPLFQRPIHHPQRLHLRLPQKIQDVVGLPFRQPTPNIPSIPRQCHHLIQSLRDHLPCLNQLDPGGNNFMELGGDEDNIYVFNLTFVESKKGLMCYYLFNYQDTVVKYLFLILFSCIIGVTRCYSRGEDSANTEVARKKERTGTARWEVGKSFTTARMAGYNARGEKYKCDDVRDSEQKRNSFRITARTVRLSAGIRRVITVIVATSCGNRGTTGAFVEESHTFFQLSDLLSFDILVHTLPLKPTSASALARPTALSRRLPCWTDDKIVELGQDRRWQ